MSWPEHGAMNEALQEKLQTNRRDVIDFSVNTNPYGAPPYLLDKMKEWLSSIFTYPDPKQTKLKKEIAKHLGVTEEEVLAGNGGAELIYATARLFTNQTVLLIEPTFTEYRLALTANHARVKSYVTTEETMWQWTVEDLEKVAKDVDAIWFCHPNNPTGTTISPNTLDSFLTFCYEKNMTVVVDEAFFDFQVTPFSFLPYVKKDYPLLVLRSMTKMFAIPGLRIGYMFGQRSLIQQIQSFLPAWNVNSLGEKAIVTLLQEQNFVNDTAKRIHVERERVHSEIEKLGTFHVFPSAVNFYLLRHVDNRDVEPLLRFLAQEGIHARHTYHFPRLEGRYFRFAVKTRKENEQLLDVLSRWN